MPRITKFSSLILHMLRVFTHVVSRLAPFRVSSHLSVCVSVCLWSWKKKLRVERRKKNKNSLIQSPGFGTALLHQLLVWSLNIMSRSRIPPSEQPTLLTRSQVQITGKKKPVKLIVQTYFVCNYNCLLIVAKFTESNIHCPQLAD